MSTAESTPPAAVVTPSVGGLPHLLAVYQVEVERLFRRVTAIIGLVMSAIFGISGPLLVALVNYAVIAPRQVYADEMAAGNPDLAAMGGPELVGWDWSVLMSFYGRNLMFLPVLIFLLGGLSMASEFRSRTTREDVLRPIARWQLLMAKWLALATWIACAIALTSIISTLLGLLLNGGFTFDETLLLGLDDATAWESFTAYAAWLWSPVGPVIKQIVTTLVMDLGFASLALCIAVLTRSVAATVASLVMVFTLQLFLAAGLGIATSDMTKQLVQLNAPWLEQETLDNLFEWGRFLGDWQPPFVLGTCDMVGVEQPWQGFVTLAVITVVSLVVALARFETMDVP